MKTQNKSFPLKHLMVVTADGTLDLAASKAALKSLAADPNFDSRCEVLLDIRGVECALSVTDIFAIAEHMASPHPALPTGKKIAVLVDGHWAGNTPLDHAQFLELCADNRGLNVRAFEDYQKADDWLTAELPDDPRDIGPAE
jgi:hypothetical protein